MSMLSFTTQPTQPSRPSSSSAYAARMSFYRLRQFQCEVTGKSGLDYFQAIESERQEARTLHSRFSEPLKPAILKAVQWRTSYSLPWSPIPCLPQSRTQRSWVDSITLSRLSTSASRIAIFKAKVRLFHVILSYVGFLICIHPLEVLVDLSGT